MEPLHKSHMSSRESSRLEVITQQNQLNSPLLRLSAELRTKIYEHVLAGEIIDIVPKFLGEWHEKYFCHALTVLQTCRQVYHEASPLVFTCCIFQHVPWILEALSRGAPCREAYRNFKITLYDIGSMKNDTERNLLRCNEYAAVQRTFVRTRDLFWGRPFPGHPGSEEIIREAFQKPELQII